MIATIGDLIVAPFELPEYRNQALDLHYFADDRSLVVILAGGDIATVQLAGAADTNVSKGLSCVIWEGADGRWKLSAV